MAKDTGNVTDLGASDQQGGRSGAQIAESAKKAIAKAKGDALQQKLKTLIEKRAEHERSINQLDEEMQREIASYEKGL